MTKPQVTIYTDGACVGNPGPGGIGVVILNGKSRQEISTAYRETTNNRMELLAAITALESLAQPCCATLFTDSKYLADAMNKGWARRWQANKWKRNKRAKAQNPDLWARLLDLCDRHQVRFRWVKGHSFTPENNRCDQLANQAIRAGNFRVDEGYENVHEVGSKK